MVLFTGGEIISTDEEFCESFALVRLDDFRISFKSS